MEIVVDLLWVFGGFVALYFGAEWLVRGASEIALKLGISPLVVGLTVVAFGTSAPELLVCIEANAQGSADQAFGTVIGSNICNIALILGVGALIKPIHVNRQIIRREIPILLVTSLVFVAMLWDKKITRLEGGILLVGIIYYVWSSLMIARKENQASEEFSAEEVAAIKKSGTKELVMNIGLILLGLVMLKLGSQYLVIHGTNVARVLSISEAIIGLVLLAFGTSLPELATSIIAARKGQGDIITGNAVGSCIFNILAVMGGAGVVKTLAAQHISWLDLGVMCGVTLLLLPLASKRRPLRRADGVLLFGLYIGYILLRFSLDQA